MEEAGHSGNMPVGEVSSKHTVVPTKLNKAQHGGVKPKALSLKKVMNPGSINNK